MSYSLFRMDSIVWAKKYIQAWQSTWPTVKGSLGKSSIPELKDPEFCILSCHLKIKLPFSAVWVFMNHLYHFYSFCQYTIGKFSWFSTFIRAMKFKARSRVGGLPSLMSLAMNWGQLQRNYRSGPRFCSRGIQPKSCIVSNQLFMTLRAS